MTIPIPGLPAGLQPIGLGQVTNQSGRAGLPSPPASASGDRSSVINVQGQKGSPDYDAGNTLLGLLSSLPPGLQADSEFAWAIDQGWNLNRGAPAGSLGDHGATTGSMPDQLTEMTMAGSLSWLRNLANTNKDQYNAIVHELVAAQYLSPSAARYGSYTEPVASAFLKSAADVWAINQDKGNGTVTTWQNHIDSMIKYGQEAGQIDANGLPLSGGSGGSGGATALPVRTDVFTNPEDVKAAANAAATNLLGRKLTDSEESLLYNHFHSMEASYNDAQWSAQQAQYNGAGGSVTETQPPSVASASKNFVDNDPSLAGDRTQQLVGSYLGVLGSMVGLGGANGGFGSGGVSRAVS